MCRFKVISAILAVVCILLPAENIYAKTDHTGLDVGQTSVLYDSSIGMPTSEANAVAQTSDGFIWIGSYSGLIRYDGTNFDRMDPSCGIASVVSLFVDSRDRLWVGTNDSGAALVQGKDITIFGRAEGLPSNSVRSLGEDKDGNILFGTTQGMVYYDGESVQTYEDPRISADYVCELRKDSRGIVYGETYEGSFFSLDGKNVRDYYVDTDYDFGEVSCITIDSEKEGWVYLGTEGKCIVHADMDGGMKEYKVIDTPKQEHIKTMELIDDVLWIGADDGIAHIDRDGNYMKLSHVDMNNSVDKMMVDYEDNMWFTSSRQGIMKIARSVFSNVTRTAGVYDRVCNTTLLYGDDLYIGTDTGLVVLDKKHQGKKTALSDLLSEARVRCLKEDSKGNIWACTFSEHGLVRMTPDGNIREYTSQDGLASERVRVVCERSNGDIAVSSSGGVTILRDGEAVAFYGEDAGVKNTEILTIEEDPAGNLYMGSDGDGIYILDQNEKLRCINSSSGMKSDVVMRAKWDDVHKVLWMVTSNCLCYLDGDDKVHIIEKFPYANNFDLFFDEYNNIWVLGSGGIYVVNAEAMMADKKIDYILYDSTSGLAHVTTANSHNFLSDEGDLYISGTTGVSSVNINENHATSTNIRLTVPFIEADNETLYLDGDSITLNANVKRIIIHGYALSYSLNNPTVYYKLEGFDETRIQTTKRDLEPAIYTNLDGGRYTYHLATVNSLTGEEEASTEIHIIKRRAFYEQQWFGLLMALAGMLVVGLLVWNYYRIRTAILEKKNRKIRQMRNEVINAFAKAIDYKDTYTNGHSFRVARYTQMLAKKLGYSEDGLEDIYNIALLHDIGKIAIPDAILNKPEALNDEEYEVMKRHAAIGYEILSQIASAPELAMGAGYHHERLDGKGYPKAVSGEDIPKVAKVIAVADTFDAMYSTRPYRKKMELSVVIDRIRESSGTQLEPEVVDKLVELFEEGQLYDIKVE